MIQESQNELLEAAKAAHRLLMSFMHNPQEMEVICRLNDAITNATAEADEDICGFCGEPGADKVPHPIRWPGEAHPESELVHAECEQEECRRAHSRLSDDQRRQFLKHC